ncbi:hypothetical protein HYW40_00815 [Candidatus Curtissbacteria bacterium]|nr:hypothetical protein [Candidatus Curtissbacteria bacterium]
MFLSELERIRITDEKEAAVEAMSIGRVTLHVAPIFWEQIKTAEPLDQVFNPQDPDKIVKRVDAIDGIFTFPPQELILGKSLESISVPLDQAWYLKKKVSLGGDELPLDCHMTAPNIHAGSSGHQTFEFKNRSADPLTVKVADLEIIALVLPLTSSSWGERGRFRHQTLEENPIPDLRGIPFGKRA